MSHISKEFNAGEIYQNNDHIRNCIYYPNAEDNIQQYVHIYKVKYGFSFYKHNYQCKTSKFFMSNRGPKVYALFPYTTLDDYRRYVLIKSSGFTKIGLQCINESIEAFIYSVLGAQTRTKQSIVSNRGSAYETQQEFRDIVEHSILNFNISLWINDMNRSIISTNIILNMAISPSLWLLSNNQIILKNPVPGYNNTIKIANKSMDFGYNNINITNSRIVTSPVNQQTILTTLPDQLSSTNNTFKSKKEDNHNTDLAIIFGGTHAAGYIMSNYIL